MFRSVLVTILAVLFAASLAGAQTEADTAAPRGQVHSIQNFFRDATVDTDAYGEGVFQFADYDYLTTIGLGARASFPVAEHFQIGGSLAFLSADPELGDGESGLMDPLVSGRYSFDTGTPTQVAAGASLTLPIGSEDIGQGNTDIGLFGAVRHPVSEKVEILGRLALDFEEQGDDRETSLGLGGGVVYAANTQLHWLAELDIATEGDYGLLSAGVDYGLRSGGHLRGALGLGLDDGAPDVAIQLGYLMVF